MCVLSFYRPRVMPRYSCLMNGAESNPHGHGYAVIVGSDIIVGKSMDAEAAIKAFIEIRTQHPESYALFHSRITTDGATSEDNCHPFLVGGDPRTVLAHNGILPKAARPGKGDERSDTRILAEELIPRDAFGHLTNRRARRRLTRWTLQDGYPNKLVILTTDPAYGRNAYIINEHLGEWSDGVWWSNDSYKPSRYSYGGYSYGSSWGGTRRRSGGASLYTEWRCDWDVETWDELYVRGIVDQKTWMQAVTACYAALDSWIKAAEDPGPPLWLRQALWKTRADERAEQGIGAVGSETVGTGWPATKTHGKCSLCGDPDGLNLVAGYCTKCGGCDDCKEPQGSCLCYEPASGKRYAELAAEDTTEQQTPARTPLALPAAPQFIEPAREEN